LASAFSGSKRNWRRAVTCLAATSGLCGPQPDKWDAVRQSVFWGFVLLVIASPAALGALILMHA
jgi:hypothetical protein